MKMAPKLLALCILTLLAACNSPEEKVTRYMQQGNNLFEAGEYTKAGLEYRNALRIQPTNPDIIYHLGLVDEANNNLKGAFESFNRAAQQNAHYDPALLKLVEYRLLAGQDNEAQKLVDSVLSDDPENAQAHALHGILLIRQKNYSDAEAEGKFALAKDFKNVSGVSVLATVYSNAGDDTKAITTIKAGLDQNPKNLLLLLLLANVYEKKADFAKLEETYQRVFAVAPNDYRYRIKLALIYADTGHLDEAEKTLRDAMKALPDVVELRHQLVQFLSSHRTPEAAEADIHAMIASYPEAPEPYQWLVDFYLSHGQIDRADGSLKEALEHAQTNKQQIALKSALARVSYAKGDMPSARSYANDVLAEDVNNLDAIFIRANLETNDGNYQDAINDVRFILRAKPMLAPALSLLSDILQKQGHINLATETYNQLVDASPNDLNARVHLAELYALNNNAGHAMDILFAITKQEPQFAPAWRMTAQIAIERKNWETADMAITKLGALEGQHDVATYLRGLYLSKSGKTDAAIKEFQAVAAANPTSPLGEHNLILLVDAYQATDHVPEAIAYLQFLKLDTPLVHSLLGNCYLLNKQNDLARAEYDMAIAEHMRAQDPYLQRAKLFVADKNTDAAVATLDKANQADPADPRAMIIKAQLFEETGRYKDAMALYSAILARNADLDIVANNLAELVADYDYEDVTELEKARLIAERFASSTDPLLIDTLAWVYYRQGHNDQAQALMVRAASMKADFNPQFHYHYGAILQKAGNTSQAAAELKLATDGTTNYPGAEDAKKLLSTLK